LFCSFVLIQNQLRVKRNGIKRLRMVSRYFPNEKQDIINEWLEEVLEEYE